MDNKQDRQLYWEVKQFLTKTPAVPVQKPTTLKDSVNSVLQENKPFRQNNFSQESTAMQPTQKMIGAHSNLINANKPSCAAYTKNGNTNPFNLNEGISDSINQGLGTAARSIASGSRSLFNNSVTHGIHGVIKSGLIASGLRKSDVEIAREEDAKRIEIDKQIKKDSELSPETRQFVDNMRSSVNRTLASADETLRNTAPKPTTIANSSLSNDTSNAQSPTSSTGIQSSSSTNSSNIQQQTSNVSGNATPTATSVVTRQQASSVSGNVTPTATSVAVANLPKPINDVYAFSPQSSMNGRNVGNILDRLRVGPGIGQSETKLNADIPPVANPIGMPQRKSEIVDSEQSTQPTQSSDIQGMMASASSSSRNRQQSSQAQAPLGSVDTSIRPIETGGSLNLSGKLGTSQQQEFRYSSGRRV